jgi:Uma2 family endonuclease
MSSSTLDPAGPWSFDQLQDLPDDGRRYEVVDGHLVVTPPPSQAHQLVANRLLRELLVACPPDWEVLSEFALPLGSDGRVPDLAVVRRHALVQDRPPYPIGPGSSASSSR